MKAVYRGKVAGSVGGITYKPGEECDIAEDMNPRYKAMFKIDDCGKCGKCDKCLKHTEIIKAKMKLLGDLMAKHKKKDDMKPKKKKK